MVEVSVNDELEKHDLTILVTKQLLFGEVAMIGLRITVADE